MKLTKLLVIFTMFIFIQSLGAFSGHIDTNTTWSSDIIITGDTWIDEGITLTIAAGVTVSFPKVDGNADGVGDVDFFINGRLLTQGAPGNKVIFTSLEDNPAPSDWGGIDYLHVLSQNSNLQYTDVLYAHQGIHISGKLFTFNYGTVQECGDYGVRVSNSYSETTSLNNLTLFENATYGLKVEANGIVNGTGILASSNGSHGIWIEYSSSAAFTNSRSVSNGGYGVNIDNSSPSFTNTYINSNALSGVNITNAASAPTFDTCTVEYNAGRGFVFQDGCDGIVEYTNIIGNGEFGLQIGENSDPVINYCNIYDNCTSTVTITEAIPTNQLYLANSNSYSSYYSIMFPVSMINQIHVSGYADHNGSSDDYLFRVYHTSSYIYEYSRQNSTSDTNFNTWANVTSTSTDQQLRVYLATYSVSGFWGRVSEIRYDPMQAQLLCANSSGVVDAGHNWWGQITGVDGLITQSVPGTVDYSEMEVAYINSAGASYTNIAPQFTLATPDTMLVNPASVTFNWTDMDVDDDAQISFYYDDGLDYTGILITEGISEDSSTDSYVWNLSGVPYALYNVYGVIDDGTNAPVVMYADGQVMVGPVSASTPYDSHGAANAQVTIPINVANTYDYFEIISFQFIVNFDNLLLSATNVETAGTLTEGWTVDSNMTIPGQITVNGFSANMLEEGGALVELKFDVLPGGTDYDDCIINISTFEFNDGAVAVTIEDGLFTVLNEYTISGSVEYYSNMEPVEAADLLLTGTEEDDINTGVDGIYEFPLHIAGNYELTPASTEAIPALIITPFDASLIARYALGTETFNNNQIIAGDVNGSLETTVHDAALIAQYSVGLISEFDAGIWKFTPDAYTFELTGGNEIVDFAAIAVGDPSGNWTTARTSTDEVWEVPTANLRESESVNIQLTFEEEFYSIMAKISYDQNEINFLGLNESDVLNNFSFFTNDTGAEVLVSCFGTDAAMSNDIILNFAFETTDENVNIEEALNIDYILFDEEFGGNIQFTDFEESTVVPAKFNLVQNSPNPFNPSTKIDFSISQDSNVILEVFNMKGQKVATLKNEIMTFGKHTVVWNADSNASGIYFYKLTSGKKTETKKMLLLK